MMRSNLFVSNRLGEITLIYEYIIYMNIYIMNPNVEINTLHITFIEMNPLFIRQ